MKKVLFVFVISIISIASAHATFVFGDLSTKPENPKAGEPFTMQLIMKDPSDFAIEDAIVFAEFTLDKEGAKMSSTKLDETDQAGVYEGVVTLADNGKYYLLLRDRTYRQEDALANLAVTLSGDAMLFPEGLNSVIFPPTATGAYSVTTWIIWLVAIPVLGGLITTIWVFTHSKAKKLEEQNKE